jgi:hypothetical protein
MRFFLSLAAVVVALTTGVVAADDKPDKDFIPIFDGKTLNGWKKVGGGATYRVEDGCVVGEVGPGANTFLRTEKSYANFILKVEAKLDVPGNSGIQFRSHQKDGDGRVFGYQCEIDPSDRAWSAGIYDEGRRGWLNDLKGQEKAQKAFKLTEWNEFVIHAEGPWLRTWLNGVPCADLIDTMDADGFIALQVHSGQKGKIRWRNVHLKELPATPWKPLLGGKGLEGWKKIGPGEWKVENGVLRGTSPASEKRHSLLATEKSYGDFAVRLRFKANKGNSGLYFRVEEDPKADVAVKGFQAEIDAAKDVGGLYETSGRGWVVQPKPEDVKKWFKPGEWNEMSVVAIGGKIVVSINGKKSAELKDDPGRKNGLIGVQLHGGQDMDVEFRNVELMTLDGLGASPRR